MTVDVSRPGKVLYSRAELTKADVVAHYEHVAGVMLPHLRDRALVLHRFPDGLAGEGFYQKEASRHFPGWLRTVTAPSRNERGEVHHAVADDVDTLRYLADQACLELHRWLSRAADLDTPDLLQRLGLVPFLQATGGDGYHVVAPLDGSTGFDEVRALARRIAERLAAAAPQGRATEQRKVNRGNRIYLDVNRNAYGQTAIAPYSLRGRPGAPVATPLDWHELGRIAPDGIELRGIRRRLSRKGDPWARIHDHARSAAHARRALEKL
jgi:bifunctional non-homologous end joining protein LigD